MKKGSCIPTTTKSVPSQALRTFYRSLKARQLRIFRPRKSHSVLSLSWKPNPLEKSSTRTHKCCRNFGVLPRRATSSLTRPFCRSCALSLTDTSKSLSTTTPPFFLSKMARLLGALAVLFSGKGNLRLSTTKRLVQGIEVIQTTDSKI